MEETVNDINITAAGIHHRKRIARKRISSPKIDEKLESAK